MWRPPLAALCVADAVGRAGVLALPWPPPAQHALQDPLQLHIPTSNAQGPSRDISPLDSQPLCWPTGLVSIH